MVNLFITSLTEKAGKTMLSAGLGRYWLSQGRQVVYSSQYSAGADPSVSNPDCLFMQKVLGPHTQDAEKQDIIINEGPLKALPAFISEYPDGKVLVVHDYAVALQSAAVEYQKVGSILAGVIINKVPRKDLETARNKLAAVLGQARIPFMRIIPEDRILMAMAVTDLAEAVQGKIVNNPQNSSELIENLMMGSSTFDRGSAYYSRKDNKAVLLWGDRPGFRKAALAGLQIAVLQTSTRCIVISSGAAPAPAAVQKADEQKVTLISAPGTLPEITAAIERAMLNLKFSQDKKLLRLEEVLGNSLDYQRLSQAIGLLS